MAEARGVHHRALPSATVPRLLVTAAGAHTFGGQEHPVIVWRPDSPFLAVATTALGGGVGERAWVLSATVDSNYAHPHPPDHLRELAAQQSLRGDGIGFLTAVDVRESVWTTDGGVEVLATVGLGWPTWAASPDEQAAPGERPAVGTINLVAWVPVRLGGAAIVNAVATVTEAKVQALAELAVPGTGTASDAVAICCPLDGPDEAYGGPRSTWGARLARATHAAVRAGADPVRNGPGGAAGPTAPPRPSDR